MEQPPQRYCHHDFRDFGMLGNNLYHRFVCIECGEKKDVDFNGHIFKVVDNYDVTLPDTKGPENDSTGTG